MKLWCSVLMFLFPFVSRLSVSTSYQLTIMVKTELCPSFSWCFERPLQCKCKYAKHYIIFAVVFEAATVLKGVYLCRYWSRELWSRKIYSSEETFWISIGSWAMGQNLTYKCWGQFVHMPVQKNIPSGELMSFGLFLFLQRRKCFAWRGS